MSLLKQQLREKQEADQIQREKDIAEYAGILRKAKQTPKDIERLDELVKALGYTPETVELHQVAISEAARLLRVIENAQAEVDELEKLQAEDKEIGRQLQALLDRLECLNQRARELRGTLDQVAVRKEELEAITATFLPLFGETTFSADAWQWRTPILPAAITHRAQALNVLKPHQGMPSIQLRMI